MCGIAGIVNLEEREPVHESELRQMLAMIRHRGPDEFGIYGEDSVGIGNARLSIVDLSGGQQPISNEDGTMWIVFNGEIFNYVELRPELEARGHRFSTSSDTEVLLHMYEEFGPDCLARLNGQFAFAVWNSRERSLFLARDRLGVRPLFYTRQHGRLVFASEIKAILAAGVTAELDPLVLHEVFTYWSPLPPKTIFKGIQEVPPGHYLHAAQGKVRVAPYWELTFPEVPAAAQPSAKTMQEQEAELAELLVDAVRIRLRADVPVGAYLSGGLDSSIIASIVRNFTHTHLDTFSIAFDDERFDESDWQMLMAKFLGTEHQVVRAKHTDIGRVFPDVVWHTEVPVMRTSPAPMYMLSKLVRDSGYKVVLTGEGADEFLAGYDIFKEAKVRRFWAREPQSVSRPKLLTRLYPDITNLAKNNPSLLTAFFREGLEDVGSPFYSHALRWRNGLRIKRFFSEELKAMAGGPGAGALAEVLPPTSRKWAPLSVAQGLEIKIFLSEYLLSSQGDRMGMAHSIEGRFPFLDYRVVALCNGLPSNLKLRGLTEKYLLKKLGRKWLPPDIWQRPKRPYRAPIHRSLVNTATADYISDLLSYEKLAATGYFNPQAVTQLLDKVRQGAPLGETDDMALAGIVSTQLLHHQFIDHFQLSAPLSEQDPVKVRSTASTGVHRHSSKVSL